MRRVGGDRREQFANAARLNQPLDGEVADKLMSRRQANVNFASLIKQKHRIVKHGIGCRGRSHGGSLLWGQARKEAKMRHARRGAVEDAGRSFDPADNGSIGAGDWRTHVRVYSASHAMLSEATDERI